MSHYVTGNVSSDLSWHVTGTVSPSLLPGHTRVTCPSCPCTRIMSHSANWTETPGRLRHAVFYEFYITWQSDNGQLRPAYQALFPPSPHLPASPRCDVCHPRVSSVAAITQCPGNLECTESPHLLSAPWPHTGHATSANCLNFISDALNTQIRSMTGGGNCVRKRRKGERANAK